MKRRLLILGTLAVVISGSVLLVGASSQQPCFPTTITVPGGQSRAALEESNADGMWTFTIGAVKGSISKVEIQIYENALPTSGKDPDLYVVCASCPDPYGRPQADCGAECTGQISTAGSVSIKRVTIGAAASITLDAGVYCVRPLAFGKGEVTVSIQHP